MRLYANLVIITHNEISPYKNTNNPAFGHHICDFGAGYPTYPGAY